MKRKSILTGLAAAVLLSASLGARAADLPYKAPAYMGPVYANWSGFYVGINGGYGFGSSGWDVPALSFAPAGALVGATVGYNMQSGMWVFGLEGDIDWSDMRGSVDCAGGSCATENDWFGTARLRLGLAGGSNWLPYLTGGAAFGNVKASNAALGAVSKTEIGWVAGFGIEYAFLANWSAKLEYLYADLGSLDGGATWGLGSDDVSFKTSIVRAGINYRF
jgi:outer membrane immunogenic protein